MIKTEKLTIIYIGFHGINIVSSIACSYSSHKEYLIGEFGESGNLQFFSNLAAYSSFLAMFSWVVLTGIGLFRFFKAPSGDLWPRFLSLIGSIFLAPFLFFFISWLKL